MAHGVDIAVRAGISPPGSTAYVAHPLSPIRRVVVGSPAYLRKHGSPKGPAELESHACFTTLANRSGSPWRFVRHGKETAVHVHGPIRASTPAALVVLARADAGLALAALGVLYTRGATALGWVWSFVAVSTIDIVVALTLGLGAGIYRYPLGVGWFVLTVYVPVVVVAQVLLGVVLLRKRHAAARGAA